jgi:hypothetical protein
MIDEVYNTVNAISNKEQRGSVSPEKFNLLANQAVNDIYNKYDLDRFINQANRGFATQGINDYVKMERERYQHFYKFDSMTISGADYVLPSDVSYLDSVTYNGVELEECHSNRHFNLMKTSEDFKATLESPVYLKINDATNGGTILVFPVEIITELELFYVRKVIPCKWTYIPMSGAPLFNPSAGDYADLDVHSSEQPSVVIHILSQLGIKLREPDLAKYAEVIKAKNIAEENAI